MKVLKQLEPQEWLSAVGALITLVGFLVPFSWPPDAPVIVKMLGFSVFMGGILLSLRINTKAVEHLRSSDLPEKVKGLSEKLDDLLPALRVGGTAMAIYDTSRSARRDPKTIVLATSNVLSEIFSKYVPQLAEKLHAYTQDPTIEIPVPDHSPIHHLMLELAESLKTGGAWFGITLLEHASAWRVPDGDTFSRFRDLMRKRASNKELCVLRLYHFESEASYQQLRREMLEEAKHGIKVKYTVGGERPADLSLLWAPRREGVTQFSLPPGASDEIGAVRTEHFEKVCALEYDTRAGALLTNVYLYPDRSASFDRVAHVFERVWHNAKELG